jgi:hypothetical protein
MTSKLTRGALAILVGAAPVLGGCSSDDDDTTPTVQSDPSQGQSFNGSVTAASGGNVATPGDTARLEVPAGAVAADVEITVEVKAPSGGSVTSVYDYGPDGTTFSVPVTLSIAYSETPPAGREPTLAMSTAGHFEALEGSTFASGRVSAPVSHFTDFTVILTRDPGAAGAGGGGTGGTSAGGECDPSDMPDTCLADLAADGCWDPSGECTVSVDMTGTEGTTVSWANGAKMEVATPTSPGAPTTMVAYGSSGSQCFTSEVTGSQTMPVTTINKDGDKYVMTYKSQSEYDVTCPDGSTESWNTDEFNAQSCLGADQSACTVEGIPGQCSESSPCPEGQVCCEVTAGMMMCVPEGACPTK